MASIIKRVCYPFPGQQRAEAWVLGEELVGLRKFTSKFQYEEVSQKDYGHRVSNIDVLEDYSGGYIRKRARRNKDRLTSDDSSLQRRKKKSQEINASSSDNAFGFIVLNKPSGVPVQGGAGIDVSIDSLVNHQRHKQIRRQTAAVNDDRLRLVHRLDKDVSGALLMAKNASSAKVLGEGMSGDGKLSKLYWAIAVAPFAGNDSNKFKGHGEVRSKIPIQRRGSNEFVEAVTLYRVLGTHGNLVWLELIPITGRMHQLRIHCARDLGMPILGDQRYGRVRSCNIQKDILNRVLEINGDVGALTWPPIFLHSRQLKVPLLDVSAQNVFLKVVAPVPKWWESLLSICGWRAANS